MTPETRILNVLRPDAWLRQPGVMRRVKMGHTLCVSTLKTLEALGLVEKIQIPCRHGKGRAYLYRRVSCV